MPSTSKTSVILLAFGALIIGNLFATFVDVFVKLYAADVSIYQYLFFRQLAVVLFLFPFWYRLPKKLKAPTKVKIHLFRALMTNIGAPCAVIALLHLSLATANVIFYAAPMVTLIFAQLFLNEAFKFHRFIITLIGFSGVIIALRPEDFGFAGSLAFVTAVAIACYNLSVKWLPSGTSMVNAIFWANLFALPLMAALGIYYWQPMTYELVVLCIAACICLIGYQSCSIYAFRKADAGAISVAEYSGLIFAAVLGWLIFEESLDWWTLAGISLIILPISWQSWYEHRQEKITVTQICH